jgi:hypothetical protein
MHMWRYVPRSRYKQKIKNPEKRLLILYCNGAGPGIDSALEGKKIVPRQTINLSYENMVIIVISR